VDAASPRTPDASGRPDSAAGGMVEGASGPPSDPSRADPSLDAGHRPADEVRDAAGPVTPEASMPADASPPVAPPDAAAAPSCGPTGTYSITRMQVSGSCNADIAAFDVMFSGKLSDPFASESCTLDAKLSADGCSMSYDQLCKTSDGSVVEREVATVRVLASGVISGPGTVTRYDPSQGSSASAPTCSSQVVIMAVHK
jgi:hypothetical protein